jgi:hypothetical protein
MRIVVGVVVGGVIGTALAVFGVTHESTPLWNGTVWAVFALFIACASCKELDHPKPTWGEMTAVSLATSLAVFVPHLARHLSGL